MSTTRYSRPIRYALIASLATAGVLGLAFRDGDAAPPQEGKPASVPFEMLASNHMIIRAKINGKGPFRLLFDVGSPITLLATKAAETSGVIKPGRSKFFLFAQPGNEAMETLELGGVKAKDIPVIIMDHPALKALGGFFGRPLDGIVGFTFFARYKTTIDYQAKIMTFEPVDFAMRDLIKDLPERLAGPKIAKEIVLAPAGLWGLTLKKSEEKNPAVSGVAILSITPDSPAATAGLKPGDILTTLDGRWTTSIADAFAAVSGAAPGRPTEVVIVRDGKELTLSVTPGVGF
jgi:hypothetical protein